MLKNNEQALWDDSALINAFNESVSKYKKMHNLESNISLQDRENDCSKEHNLSAHNDDSSDAGRLLETSDVMAIASDAVIGMEESSKAGMEASSKATSQVLEPSVSEKLEASSNGQCIQPTDLQNTGDYDHLVTRYYEIEDQRQKVLQQLNQVGYWNNGYSSVPVISQEHQASVGEAYQTTGCSLCPYGCQSWVTPCSSINCCLDGCCAGKRCKAIPPAACYNGSASLEDNDFVNTAMVAAEKALCSFKEQASTSRTVTDKEKEKQPECIAGDAVKNTSSQTDLTVVFNAWYSAGFYTGKYLSEQASAKDRHG